MLRVAACLAILLSAANVASASVEHARELIGQARAELEAVLVAKGSSQEERQAAMDLLKRLDGGQGAAVEESTPPPSIVDNGNGTVTDRTSGLMWPVKDNAAEVEYDAAKSYCEGSKRGGHDDWRVPTLAELGSLQTDTFGAYKLPDAIHLSGCRPWLTVDNRSRASNFEIDFCTGDRGFVIPQHKKAPVLCVRGPDS